MKKIICSTLFLVLVLTSPGFSQTLRRPLAAAYAGLGAYSESHADLFSFTSNQASLAQLKQAAAGVYAERRFLLSELNSFTAVAGLPTSSGNFGWKASYYGFTGYNETQLGLAYARNLGKNIDAGVQFNYNGIQIAEGYGNAAAISFDAGILLLITERLRAGVQVSNPAGGKFGKSGEELAAQYSFGMGFEASEKFFFGAEIVKEEDRPVNVHAGLQYKFIPQLLARTGLSTSTSSLYFGVGLLLRSCRLDITTSYHPQLGLSPGLMFLAEFKKTAK